MATRTGELKDYLILSPFLPFCKYNKYIFILNIIYPLKYNIQEIFKNIPNNSKLFSRRLQSQFNIYINQFYRHTISEKMSIFIYVKKIFYLHSPRGVNSNTSSTSENEDLQDRTKNGCGKVWKRRRKGGIFRFLLDKPSILLFFRKSVAGNVVIRIVY